jgi:hypothetical protein
MKSLVVSATRDAAIKGALSVHRISTLPSGFVTFFSLACSESLK